jgi:hypothetical protein
MAKNWIQGAISKLLSGDIVNVLCFGPGPRYPKL